MMPDAPAFAREWIAAWNARDLERVLGHYAERVTGSGRVEGHDSLRRYWRTGLAANPDLSFSFDAVLAGHGALTILYRNHRGQQVAETVEFDAQGKVARSVACYGS